MKITIEISKSKFNRLWTYIENYDVPAEKQFEINMFITKTIGKMGIELYDGFGWTEFYRWLSIKVAKKFKLKKSEE